MPTQAQLNALINISGLSYNEPPKKYTQPDYVAPPNYTLVQNSIKDDPGGFDGRSYYNATTKEVVIAFGGTGELADYFDDISIVNQGGWMKTPFDQMNAAVEYTTNILSQFGSDVKVTFTGHSLGGFLAQYAYLQIGKGSAVVFNSPGLNDVALIHGGYNTSHADITYVYSNPQTWGPIDTGIHTFGDHFSKEIIFIKEASSHGLLSLRNSIKELNATFLTHEEIMQGLTRKSILESLIQKLSDQNIHLPILIKLLFLVNQDLEGLLHKGLESMVALGQMISENIVRKELERIQSEINTAQGSGEIPPALNCFPASTLIMLSDGSEKAIEEISIGDEVLSFDKNGEVCRGSVTRLYSNVTDHFLKLEFGDGRDAVYVTEGHHFADPAGGFTAIGEMVRDGRARIVLENGGLETVLVSKIEYSFQTAHLFEEGVGVLSSEAVLGNLALKPEEINGWKTYNI